jgi:hypothetical protein
MGFLNFFKTSAPAPLRTDLDEQAQKRYHKSLAFQSFVAGSYLLLRLSQRMNGTIGKQSTNLVEQRNIHLLLQKKICLYSKKQITKHYSHLMPFVLALFHA